MKTTLPATLLGACLLVGSAIVYALAAPIAPVPVDPVQWKPRISQSPTLQQADAPPAIDQFADIDAHPVFDPHRTALPGAAASGGAATGASDFSLTGVIMGGERAVVLLKVRSTSATVTAAVGDSVDGWRVTRIDATAVTLRGNGGAIVVPLDGPASQAPSAPLPPLSSAASQASTEATQASPAATSAQSAPASATASATAAPAISAVHGGVTPVAARAETTTATTSRPALPAKTSNGTISPEALKGAPIDPSTGQPTL